MPSPSSSRIRSASWLVLAGLLFLGGLWVGRTLFPTEPGSVAGAQAEPDEFRPPIAPTDPAWARVDAWLHPAPDAPLELAPGADLAAWLRACSGEEIVAWADACSLPGPDRIQLFQAVLQLQASVAPEKLLTLGKTLASGVDTAIEREIVMGTAVQSVAGAHPARLWTWLQSEPPSATRAKWMGLAAARRCASDPAALGQAWFTELNDPFHEEVLAQSFARSAAEGSPGDAARLAGQLPAGPLRRALVEKSLERLIHARPDDWPAQLTASVMADLDATTLAAMMSRRDSPQITANGLDALAPHRDAPGVASCVSALAEIWAQREPEAAAAWLAKHPDQIADPALRLRLAPFVATVRADVVRQWAESTPDPALRDLLTARLTAASALRDPDGTLASVLNLPAGTSRTGQLRQVASVLAQQQPDRVADLLASHPEAASTPVVQSLAERLAATNVAAAFQWTQTLPESHRLPGETRAVATWTATDPAAALQWINAQPESPRRNGLLAAHCASLADAQPDAALRLAQGLPAEANRLEVVQAAFHPWLTRDPLAAAAWLQQESSRLTPIERDALTQRLEQVRETALSQNTSSP